MEEARIRERLNDLKCEAHNVTAKQQTATIETPPACPVELV